ncbi:MAG: TetR/AcrR family transcriptional regulator [Proteobacteria bacterium]|nr:TetR/AcrR family transcriptional regulator [Pseudomonadota bacterium]
MSIRKRLSHEESRLAALEAARDLLIELGPQAVTLKAVAARIGRTHANLLHHFGSAAGLQKALAEHHAVTICDKIEATIRATHSGAASQRDVVDLVFDAFGSQGGGALATWMLLSGNEDALDPIFGSIHDLVDHLADLGAEKLRPITQAMVLMALGDALLGAPLAATLGLKRDAVREVAADLAERAKAEAGIGATAQAD